MKMFIAAFVAIICVDSMSAILQIGQPIPADWPISLVSSGYAKDRDDCRFGYRFNEDNRVIQILNCTTEDPTVFYVLTHKVCGRDIGLETCASTPIVDDVEILLVEDNACANVRVGVAPDPNNCCRFLQCADDGSMRHGRRFCDRGQYFSSVSYRCEFMWSEGEDGTISSLNEQDMCGNRPIPAGRRRNHGVIMEKCRYNWNFDNFDTYSVSEPVDCQFYYLCSRYNPTSQDSSVVNRCNGDNLYWSDSRQTCVLSSEMTDAERRACSI